MLKFVPFKISMQKEGSSVSYLTLSELLQQVRDEVAIAFPRPVWLRADMLKINHYTPTGHAFPELVEKEGGKITARVQAVIWADDLKRITETFSRITGKEPGDGMSLLLQAEIRFHELYGMRLRIYDIDPSFTLGQMAMEKQKAIERLKAEGLFELNHRLHLPSLPQRLAVISATTSRGFNDLKTILRDEGKAFRMELRLYTAVLQGEKAITTIRSQLRRIAVDRERFDAILIIRGGGDESGMDCYDHYELARAVCECPIPVITGIGHSTNETVVEMVAHTNKITPTEVGYFVLSHFHEHLNYLGELTGRIRAQSLMSIAEHESWIDEQASSIYYEVKETRMAQKQYLDHSASVIQRFSASVISRAERIVNMHQLKISAGSSRHIMTQKHQTEVLSSILAQKPLTQIREAMLKLSLLEQKVESNDPIAILSKGYSITKVHGKAIKDISELRPGDHIETITHSGIIESEVQRLNPTDHGRNEIS